LTQISGTKGRSGGKNGFFDKLLQLEQATVFQVLRSGGADFSLKVARAWSE
jgi:hypothetical protein